MNKEYYETEIKKSETKQEMLRIGLQSIIGDKKADLDHIQKCFIVYQEEKTKQQYLQEELNKLNSGETEKRENAKKLLGIGGRN